MYYCHFPVRIMGRSAFATGTAAAIFKASPTKNGIMPTARAFVQDIPVKAFNHGTPKR